MEVQNQMEVSFPSKSSNEGFARMCVAAFVAQLDPTVEELSEIKTAVSEAVTNCIVHGYSNAIGIIKMKTSVLENGVIRIVIRDKGRGIENVQQAMEPCYSTGGEDRAGMGFTIMESFMDKVKVKSVPGKGTTVTLERRIIKRS